MADNLDKSSSEPRSSIYFATPRDTYRAVLGMYEIQQLTICYETERLSHQGQGRRVHPAQLNRWLRGKDLYGDAIETLEEALPEEARALYFGYLANGINARANRINSVTSA